MVDCATARWAEVVAERDVEIAKLRAEVAAMRDKMQEDFDRYRAALEIYADDDNYMSTLGGYDPGVIPARAALLGLSPPEANDTGLVEKAWRERQVAR